MKTFKIILLIYVILFCTSCRMFKNEVERNIKNDVREYLNDNYDSYHAEYNKKLITKYKDRIGWTFGAVSGTLALLGSGGGLLLLKRKLGNKNGKEKNN